MGTLKLGGIASGLDTDGLIKQLMAVERRPIAVLDQRREKYTTEASAWRDLNNRLRNLQNRVSDLKKINNSDWDAKKSSVADEKILKASVSSTAVAGTYTVNVLSRATATTWQSNLSVGDATADLGYSGTIQVNGGPGDTKTFDVSATDSLNDIAATINARNDLGFKASVLQVNPNDYRLVLKGQDGLSNDFSLSDQSGTAASQLKLLNAGPDSGIQVTAAANGSIMVDNVAVSAASNKVTGIIPGMTFDLLQTGTTTVTVSSDTQKVVDAVKGFVDQYNSVVDFISQQNEYDAKTKKSGALFGESALQSISSSLSRQTLDPVTGLAAGFDSLSSIGITTEKFTSGGVTGKLTFDQSKFTEQLKADPDAVKKLFTSDGASKGVAVRLYDTVNSYTKSGGLILGQAKVLDDSAERVKNQVKYYDEVLAPKKEKRLRDQFIAMEKAMSMFQNQGSWLSSQVSSWG